MGLLDTFQKLIEEHGSSSILRDRISLHKDEIRKVEKELGYLKKRCSDLEEENAKLRAQLESKSAKQEFIEYRGAFFKRKPSGGYDPTVYCPSCHGPMYSLQNFLPFSCDRCNVNLNFTGADLDHIFKELQKEQP